MVVRGSGGLAWSSKQRGNSGTLDYISRPAVIVSYHERWCIAGEEERGEGRKRGGRRRDFHFLGCCLVRFGALVSSSFFSGQKGGGAQRKKSGRGFLFVAGADGPEDRDAPTQRARGGRFRPRLGSTPMRTSARRGPIRKGPFLWESSAKWLLFSHYLRIQPANHGLVVWLALRRTWEGSICTRLIRGLALGKQCAESIPLYSKHVRMVITCSTFKYQLQLPVSATRSLEI